jgi:hypothetical protein
MAAARSKSAARKRRSTTKRMRTNPAPTKPTSIALHPTFRSNDDPAEPYLGLLYELRRPGPRGVPLVELAIERIVAHRGSGARQGLSEKQIAELAFPGGRPLPPSLARFLAFDAEYLGVLEGNPPRLRFRSFMDMIRELKDFVTPELYEVYTKKVFTQPCLSLPAGSERTRFLYAGKPDAYGEYPIFALDLAEAPYVAMSQPGLDVYLAEGVLSELTGHGYADDQDFNGVYGPDLVDQARRNFHGFVSIDMLQRYTEHVDGDAAMRKRFAAVFGIRYDPPAHDG